MRYPKQLTVALTAGTLLFALAACGGDADGDGDKEPSAEQTAANGEVFNDADVDFATAMIPHHAQALAMVDLTRGRKLTPQAQQLTEDIQAAQVAEIETMVDWLTAWDQPVPETMRDHANADDSDGMGGHGIDDSTDSDLPGMISGAELADLADAHDHEFEDRWVALMISHHEGAVETARDEQTAGVFQSAIDLAESIETSQQAEIDRMQGILGS